MNSKNDSDTVTAQKDSGVYAFSGRYALAQVEALRTILTHEEIHFQTGAGADSAVCVIVRQEDVMRAREATRQWYEAVQAVHGVVWGHNGTVQES